MEQQKTNFRELPTEDLQSMVETSRAKLQQMRISHGLNLLDQPSSLKVIRREIARALTELNARAKSAQ